MVRNLLLIVLIGLAPAGALSASNSYSCEAPAVIREAIAKAGSRGMESLLSRYPDNFWVQRAYIDSKASQVLGLRGGAGILEGPAEESIIARFRKEYEMRPRDPEAAYLYAYSMVHTNTGKSIEILTSLVQEVPDFPAAWLTLATLHVYPKWDDAAKVSRYTEGYLARCPDSIEPRALALATQLDKPEIQLAYAKALRARIAGKADEELIPLYIKLWQLESSIAIPAAEVEFRRLLEDDLKFLEGLDRDKSEQVSMMLMMGYQRTGNVEGRNRISLATTKAATRDQAASSSQAASFTQALQDWTRANPAPASNASREAQTAYLTKRLQFIDQWRDRVPQNPGLLALRFNTLASLPGTPDRELIREGGNLLAAFRKVGISIYSADFLAVLRTWAQRGLELDLIPSLVQEILASQKKLNVALSATAQSDLLGVPSQSRIMENRSWATNTGAWAVLVAAYSKNQQLDQARSVLAEWEKALDERRKTADEINARMTERLRNASPSERSSILSSPAISADRTLVSGIVTDESRYYEGCAQVAVAEGRTLDSLTFYQTSLRLMYGRNSMSPNIADLDAGKEADALWKKLGGTRAGWDAWLESIRTVPGPKAAPEKPGTNRALPAFTLTDQSGKQWTLEDLKGKTTLVNVWATWCAPCRKELPLLQQLYEQIKDRKDIQVVTLNIDDDKSQVAPYLKNNGFSFPALFASDFVRNFAGSIGIPTTWISDTTGTIRSESRGFAGGGSEWTAQMLKQMENVRMAAK